MTIQAAYKALAKKLSALYEPDEAGNISDWVIEAVTGKRQQQRLLAHDELLNEDQQIALETYTLELLEYRPVQYVLGISYFYNLKLFVDENVLIPRPETEELVHWALKSALPVASVIVDLGTGSGCIALALKRNLPQAKIIAADLSEQSLAVAQKNAADLQLDVQFVQMDMLSPDYPEGWPMFDVIISNPPYITLEEQATILPHVLNFEPHQALFVTNNDPLQFYKAIEGFAAAKLKPSGMLFLELHRDFAEATRDYYTAMGWVAELKQDMQENDRMLRCYRPAAGQA